MAIEHLTFDQLISLIQQHILTDPAQIQQLIPLNPPAAPALIITGSDLENVFHASFGNQALVLQDVTFSQTQNTITVTASGSGIPIRRPERRSGLRTQPEQSDYPARDGQCSA